MSENKTYFKHLLISFVLLSVLAGAVFVFRSKIIDFIINPSAYINGVSNIEIYFVYVFISLIVIIVFISYIIYLLITYKSRFDLEIINATKSLALSKEQFKSLYESAPVPYIMLDKSGEIRNPNKAALRFFGVFPEEIEGKNLFSYLSGENKEQADRFLQYYKAHIAINRKEVAMITKNGESRMVQLSVFEMKNVENPSTTGLVMIFDVTEQKLLDKAKSEFVSLASHQLKTPLATTKWLTEMLLSGGIGEISPKQKEYVDKLHTANEDMISLVDVLLNVSRIEMGSLSVEIKQTNVVELSESIFGELELQINKKGIHIEKQYKDSLLNIRSDPKLLRIIIQNLITNAIKYTPEGGTITITFEEFADEKRIIISDTGLGIPKEQQNLVFTKLFRADNVRGLNDSQSTGLGLYLVKSVVSSIGGDISFVSEQNKGSTFTITL